MNDKKYWVWLQNCVGYATDFAEILDHFGSPEAVFRASTDELMECRYVSRRKALQKKIAEHDIKHAEEIVQTCSKHNIHIVTYDSDEYPCALRGIINPPMILYVRGDVDCLSADFTVAVIGSRTPCKYGEESARKIVSGLVSDYNAVIVSGGALGIDSVSHLSAINRNGKTVLVMGCGHGDGYLPENSELRKSVFMHGGALVSEYPPYFSPYQGSFPDRNRIISGLSRAVVIVEAAERSGTFSTARHAMKQNRSVYVLPGDIDSGNFAGSNQLITEGATPIFSADDVVAELVGIKRKRESVLVKSNTPFSNIGEASEYSKKNKNKAAKKQRSVHEEKEKAADAEKNIEKVKKNLPETISKNAETVYNLMSDGKCTLDELVSSSELLPAKILAALTELELEGIAEKTADAYRLL